MLFFVPLGENSDPFRQRNLRPIAEIAFEFCRVGVGRVYISLLHGHHLQLGVLAEGLFERMDEIHQLNGMSASDVIDFGRNRTVLCRGRGFADDADHPFDDVVDIGEVA